MDGFSSLQELYERITPALKCKVNDLRRIGVNYVKKEDIWNYLKDYVWSKKTNLTLGEMVNDCMTLKSNDIEKYVQEIMAKTPRTINEENLL